LLQNGLLASTQRAVTKFAGLSPPIGRTWWSRWDEKCKTRLS